MGICDGSNVGIVPSETDDSGDDEDDDCKEEDDCRDDDDDGRDEDDSNDDEDDDDDIMDSVGGGGLTTEYIKGCGGQTCNVKTNNFSSAKKDSNFTTEHWQQWHALGSSS